MEMAGTMFKWSCAQLFRLLAIHIRLTTLEWLAPYIYCWLVHKLKYNEPLIMSSMNLEWPYQGTAMTVVTISNWNTHCYRKYRGMWSQLLGALINTSECLPLVEVMHPLQTRLLSLPPKKFCGELSKYFNQLLETMQWYSCRYSNSTCFVNKTWGTWCIQLQSIHKVAEV